MITNVKKEDSEKEWNCMVHSGWRIYSASSVNTNIKRHLFGMQMECKQYANFHKFANINHICGINTDARKKPS